MQSRSQASTPDTAAEWSLGTRLQQTQSRSQQASTPVTAAEWSLGTRLQQTQSRSQASTLVTAVKWSPGNEATTDAVSFPGLHSSYSCEVESWERGYNRRSLVPRPPL